MSEARGGAGDPGGRHDQVEDLLEGGIDPELTGLSRRVREQTTSSHDPRRAGAAHRPSAPERARSSVAIGTVSLQWASRPRGTLPGVRRSCALRRVCG